jgi:hypothetical protein
VKSHRSAFPQLAQTPCGGCDELEIERFERRALRAQRVDVCSSHAAVLFHHHPREFQDGSRVRTVGPDVGENRTPGRLAMGQHQAGNDLGLDGLEELRDVLVRAIAGSQTARSVKAAAVARAFWVPIAGQPIQPVHRFSSSQTRTGA